MMKKTILIIAAAALTASCSIYSKYERPENVVPLDSLYRAELTDVSAAVDSSSLAYMTWEEIFTDPYLQSLITEGLENNTDYLTAALRVEQAQARLMAAKLSYLPSLNLAPQGGINAANVNGDWSSSWTYSAGVSASWDIDLFGSLLNAKRSSQAVLLQQEAYRQAVRSQLIATIAGTYYSILMLDEQVSVSEETLGLWKEQVRAMEAMFRYGRITENELTQSRAQMYSLEASLENLKRQRQETENALCSVLGRVSSGIDRGQLSDQKLPENLDAGIPLELLSNRPDVYYAEMALASAYYNTNQARSAFYPKLTLSGSAGWTNSLGQAIVNPGGWILSALASLAQPIFNKGQLVSNLRVSKAEEEIALLNYRQALLDAGEEVNNALYALESYDIMKEKHEAQLKDLKRTAETSEDLYRTNKCSYLEMLVAQQSYLQAQLNVVSDIYNRLQSGVNLYRAVGGGR